MEKSISCVDRNFCCGCGACEAICPTNAIKLKLDKNGFYYPEVVEAKCVNCGFCAKICIANG